MTSSSIIILRGPRLRGAAGRALCPLVVVGWAIYSSVTAGGGQVAAEKKKNLRGTHSAGHKHQSDVNQSAKIASTLIEKQGKHSHEREHAVAKRKTSADGMDGKDSKNTPKEHVKKHNVQLDHQGKYSHHQANGKQEQKHSKPAKHSPPHGAGGAVVHKSKTLAGDGMPKPISAAGTSAQHDENNWYQFGGFVFVKILCALTMGFWLPIVLASPYVRAHFPKILLAEDQGHDALRSEVHYLTPIPLFAAFLQSVTWLILILVATATSGAPSTSTSGEQPTDWPAFPSALHQPETLLEVCALCISLSTSLALIVGYPFMCDGRHDVVLAARTSTSSSSASSGPTSTSHTRMAPFNNYIIWHNFRTTYFLGVLVCALYIALISIAGAITALVSSPHSTLHVLLLGVQHVDHQVEELSFYFFLALTRYVSLVSTVILFREGSFNNVFGAGTTTSSSSSSYINEKNLIGTIIAIVMTCAWCCNASLEGEGFAIYFPTACACCCYTASLLIRVFILPVILPHKHYYENTSSTGRLALTPSSSADESSSCQEHEDIAARGRFISLGNQDRASRFACHVPAIVTFSLAAVLAILLLWTIRGEGVTFFYIFNAANLAIATWFMCMQVFTSIGIYKQRLACSQNWGEKWNEFLACNPGIDNDLLHFVVIPNYKEGEAMLAQTVENVANNDLAKKYMVCVLAMEEREGAEGREKADRLISRHKHLFMDMFATYHPYDLPGERKGKASNEQWAFREIQKCHASYLRRNHDKQNTYFDLNLVGASKRGSKDEETASGPPDTSKVFINIVDADSIHHKEYFANLTLNALQKMTKEERSWTMWQPPQISLRNWNTLPRLVRATSYAVVLFELSGCVTSPLVDHYTCSTYTLTLALASHAAVDGWDVSMIAEDHHMFLKCFCAAHWESLSSEGSNRSIRSMSKLNFQPVFTPVITYMPEDDRGSLHTIYARYQQGQRHLQGICHTAYLLLQYFTIAFTSREPLPLRVHLQFIALLVKYGVLVILANVMSLVGLAMPVLCTLSLCSAGARAAVFERAAALGQVRQEDPLLDAMCTLLTIVVPIWLVSSVATSYLATKDTLSGLYCPLYYVSKSGEEAEEKAFLGTISCGDENEDRDANSCGCTVTTYGVAEANSHGNVLAVKQLSTREELRNATVEMKQILPLTRKLSARDQMKILIEVLIDIWLTGYLGMLLFCTIPLLQAVVRLSIHGHTMEYICAPKPETDTTMRESVLEQDESIDVITTKRGGTNLLDGSTSLDGSTATGFSDGSSQEDEKIITGKSKIMRYGSV